MKDYYGILECSPMSTRDEIKRNYRRLAHLFHPDKNSGNAYAASRFHDIKEAYETLTQPSKKDAWLQERWLNQVLNKSVGETAPLTPYYILDKTLKLEKYLSTADEFRMDKFGMSKKLEDLLCDENISCLQQFNDADINRTIIIHILSSAVTLPLILLNNVTKKLNILAGDDIESRKNIHLFIKTLEQKNQKERYTVPLILLATMIICLLIFWMGKQA
jgi:molecular chaperone DnaJ